MENNYLLTVDEVLLQQERDKVRQEYERELAALRSQFAEMHMSKIQVQSEFETLKNQYENQIKKIDSKVNYIYLFSNKFSNKHLRFVR